MNINADLLFSRGRNVSTYNNSNIINFYVDGVLGDDNNDGLSPTPGPGGVGPLKTVPAIYNKMPLANFDAGSIAINLASDGLNPQSYEITQSTVFYQNGGCFFLPSVRFVGPEMVPAVLTTGPTVAALDVVPAVEVSLANASGVATPLRTRLDFTAAAPGWTVDDMAGRYFLRVTRSGLPQYFELPISGNGVDFIYVDTSSSNAGISGAIAGDILSTDVVEVVMPGAIIINTLFPLVNIAGTGSTIPALGSVIFGGPSSFTRIRFDVSLVSDIPLTLDRCSSQVGNIGSISSFNLVNCAKRTGTMYFAGGTFNWFGPIFSSGTVNNPNPSVTIAMYNSALAAGITGAPFPFFIGPTGAAVVSFQLPVGIWKSVVDVGQKSAILSAGPGSLVCFGSVLVGDIDTITNPNLPGIKARHGGQVIINSDLTGIIGDPAYGDLQVNFGQAIFYGTSLGQYKEAAGYNGHFTRLIENGGDASRITDQPILD